MVKNSRRNQLCDGCYSVSLSNFPCCRRLFPGAAVSAGKQVNALNYGRGSGTNFGCLRALRFIRCRLYQASASFMPCVNCHQQYIPLTRIIYYHNHIKAHRSIAGRKPGSGRGFTFCIPCRRCSVYRGHYPELEANAPPQ